MGQEMSGRFTIDLFGNERPASAGAPGRRGGDLFDAAAETLALESGRPRSQERAEIVAPVADACPECGRSVGFHRAGCSIELEDELA
jgi:hypothetical protein